MSETQKRTDQKRTGPLELSFGEADLTATTFPDYKRVSASAIIRLADGRIILQQRTANAPRAAGLIGMFGGHVEEGETLTEALCRELEEELGVYVTPQNLVSLGATIITNSEGELTLSARMFWQAGGQTIASCHEGTPVYFASAAEALDNQKLTLSTRWAIGESLRRGYIS